MGFFKETGLNANLFKGNTFLCLQKATYQSPHFTNTASELKGDCSLYHRGIAVWIPEFFFIRLYKIFLSGLPPLPSQENTTVGYVCVSGSRARGYGCPGAVTPHGGSVPLPASRAAPRWPLPSLPEGCFKLCSKFKHRHFIRSGMDSL